MLMWNHYITATEPDSPFCAVRIKSKPYPYSPFPISTHLRPFSSFPSSSSSPTLTLPTSIGRTIVASHRIHPIVDGRLSFQKHSSLPTPANHFFVSCSRLFPAINDCRFFEIAIIFLGGRSQRRGHQQPQHAARAALPAGEVSQRRAAEPAPALPRCGGRAVAWPGGWSGCCACSHESQLWFLFFFGVLSSQVVFYFPFLGNQTGTISICWVFA